MIIACHARRVYPRPAPALKAKAGLKYID